MGAHGCLCNVENYVRYLFANGNKTFPCSVSRSDHSHVTLGAYNRHGLTIVSRGVFVQRTSSIGYKQAQASNTAPSIACIGGTEMTSSNFYPCSNKLDFARFLCNPC